MEQAKPNILDIADETFSNQVGRIVRSKNSHWRDEVLYTVAEFEPEVIADFYIASKSFQDAQLPSNIRRGVSVREVVDRTDILFGSIDSIRVAAGEALINELLYASCMLPIGDEIKYPELPADAEEYSQLFDVCELDTLAPLEIRSDFPIDRIEVVLKIISLRDAGIIRNDQAMPTIAKIAHDLMKARTDELCSIVSSEGKDDYEYSRQVAKPWTDISDAVLRSYSGEILVQIHAIDDLLHSIHVNGPLIEHICKDEKAALEILDAKDAVVDSVKSIADRGTMVAKRLFKYMQLPSRTGD